MNRQCTADLVHPSVPWQGLGHEHVLASRAGELEESWSSLGDAASSKLEVRLAIIANTTVKSCKGKAFARGLDGHPQAASWLVHHCHLEPKPPDAQSLV